MRDLKRPTFLVVAAMVAVVVAACSSSAGGVAEGSQSRAPASTDAVQFTPVLGTVQESPVPFAGSDGLTHLVYELLLTNASSGPTTLSSIEVVDADTDAVVAVMSADAIAENLQLLGHRMPTELLPTASSGLVFMNVTFAEPDSLPRRLIHRVRATAQAAPPGSQESVAMLAPADVSTRTVPVLAAPLSGAGFVSADSCCDSYRHRRAAFPLNGRLSLAQRLAIDWEQVGRDGRLWSGLVSDLNSYVIYGKDVFAGADSTVEAVVDGLPDQVPPDVDEVTFEHADGNHVILNLGNGAYALYAHLIPGSITVAAGDTVSAGQVLGRVGNSGNSIAPHLHFHVMDGPNPLSSSGVPYALTSFDITGQVTGGTPLERTAAFDYAEANGTVVPIEASQFHGNRTDEFPLDQLVITMNHQ
ncbi:MAG: M23 family metallopeptidase [bacterium]|nr:M23 family metallopeptidase [bacterium]